MSQVFQHSSGADLAFCPLSAHELWNYQTHLIEIRQPIVLSSSISPSPHGSVTFERKDPWGDGSRSKRRRFQNPRDDDSKSKWWQFKIQGITVSIQTRELYLPLTGCSENIYYTWHVSCFHWILSQIEASLRLPCTFLINITPSSLISLFFAKNILLERICHTCPRPLYLVVVSAINALPSFTNYFGKYSLFPKSFFLSYILFIFLHFIPPSPLLVSSES